MQVGINLKAPVCRATLVDFSIQQRSECNSDNELKENNTCLGFQNYSDAVKWTKKGFLIIG